MNALLLAQALGYVLAGGIALTIPMTSATSTPWRRFAAFALIHSIATWILLLNQALAWAGLDWFAAGLDILAAFILLDAAARGSQQERPALSRTLVTMALILGLAVAGHAMSGVAGLGWPLVAACLFAACPRCRGEQPWMSDRTGNLLMNSGLAVLAITAGLAAWVPANTGLNACALLPPALLVAVLIRATCQTPATTIGIVRWLRPVIVAVPCLALGTAIGDQMVDEHSELQQHHLTTAARAELDLVGNQLLDHWNRGTQAAVLISTWPETMGLLIPDAADDSSHHDHNRARFEARLDALAIGQGLSLAYLLNASGTAMASTNRDSPNNLEGRNYAFRPYFQDAVSNGTGNLISMGTTTGRRGFYASAAIRIPDGRLVGVAVVKQDLDQFAPLLNDHPDILVLDSDGCVAAGGHSDWIGRPLTPHPVNNHLQNTNLPHTTSELARILNQPLAPGTLTADDGNTYFCTLSPREIESCTLVALTDLAQDRHKTALLIVLVTVTNLLILAVFLGADVLMNHGHSLRRSRTLLHEIIERATDAIIVLRRSDRGELQVVLANPVARRYLPTATPTLIGQKWSTLNGIASEPWLNEAILRSWTGDHISAIEQAMGQGAEERWLRCTLAQHDGLLTVTITDITGHRRTEEERRRQRDFIRRILDADPNPVMLRSPDGRCLFINRACTELMGIGADDITGKHPSEILPVPDEAAPLTNGDQDVLDQGTLRESELPLTRADGRMRIFKLTKRAMRLADGRNSIYSSATDITALRSALDDAQRARVDAELATRAKDGFLATMGHEIRTPLNGVLGMLQLLQRTALSALQGDYIRTARRSAESLLTLLNDLLDFAKIESGHLDLECATFDLRQMVHDAVDQFHGRYDPARIELVVRIAPDLPTIIENDPGRFRQILANILSNALKFTEQGQVQVQLEQELTGTLRHLRLRISDTGIGITPEQQSRLFRAFEMGDASTTRRFGGTGLGLALCKRLVDLMGGTIAVESRLEQGSSFTVLLPLHGSSSAPEASIALAHQRILIVDDQEIARTVISEALENAGAIVATYASSGEMLASLYVASHDRQPAVVVIDQLMPDMAGEDVVRAIRSDPHLNRIALLLTISSPERCSPTQAADIGCDGYLPKPLRSDELAAVVAEIQRRRAANDHTLVTRESIALANVPLSTLISGALINATILLVDDNPVNAEVARSVVTRCCSTVLIADNGYRALDILEHQPVDLVLMDVQMPGMDGFATTAAIRRRESEQGDTNHLPIIALTGSLTHDARTSCLEAGMDDHCKKPLTEAGFQAIMTRWLARRDLQPPPPSPGATS
jgi:PAS domain S-box-containing protein